MHRASSLKSNLHNQLIGVVVHLPSFFAEIKATEDKGISTAERLYLSDRAHLVFDFHQLIDGLKEGELRKDGADLGTTKKGMLT